MPRAPTVSIRGPGGSPWLTAHKVPPAHRLAGSAKVVPCSEHLGRTHPAPWPDTDVAAAKAGADAAVGDEDVADAGGAVVGGGGEVKGVPSMRGEAGELGGAGGSAHAETSSHLLVSPVCCRRYTVRCRRRR